MKLGVSTLGCPEWTLEEIVIRLPAYGYDGVELRGLGPHLDLTQSPHFATPQAAEKTRRRLEDAGLTVCALDTSCAFSDADPDIRRRNREAAENAIVLAHLLKAPTVRVFGGEIAEGVRRADAVNYVAESVAALGEFAEQTGGNVSVVLETHDSFSTGAQVADVLRQVAHPSVGALWDLHHPYRQGEGPEETFAALGPYVKQVHVKDSRPGGTYCLLGEGDVPISRMLRLLHQGGYGGWVNLEWEKRWLLGLADPVVAFPQYAARLREILKEL